jgi:hypothetical protein
MFILRKKWSYRLIPTGAYALNKLGLSTQVPMKVVFLTDGAIPFETLLERLKELRNRFRAITINESFFDSL